MRPSVMAAIVVAFALAACGGQSSSDGAGPGSGGSGGTGLEGGTGNAAGSGGAWIGGCDLDGKHYSVGESFKQNDCVSCTCSSDGNMGCGLDLCGCFYEGEFHASSTSFSSKDGCNLCECYQHTVSCTEQACTGCTYAGTVYPVGDQFPALDGCNTCSCTQSGGASCTELACPCDPEKEWWHQYSDAATPCPVASCPEPTTPFQNSCGCGCEQSSSCPEYLDCLPPNDCTDLSKKCPFSKLAR